MCLTALACTVFLAVCLPLSVIAQNATATAARADTAPVSSVPQIIPKPVSMVLGQGSFTLSSTASIVVPSGSDAALPVAQDLADYLRPATGYSLPVVGAGPRPTTRPWWPMWDYVGGDEVPSTLLSQARYASFINTEASYVQGQGKTVMGWADIAGPDQKRAVDAGTDLGLHKGLRRRPVLTASSQDQVSGIVATLAAPGYSPSAVTATVNWGDGTGSAGAVADTAPTATTVNSLYAVGGTHNYAGPGVYQATVTISARGITAVTSHFTVSAP